jgi:hypothetical protein
MGEGSGRKGIERREMEEREWREGIERERMEKGNGRRGIMKQTTPLAAPLHPTLYCPTNGKILTLFLNHLTPSVISELACHVYIFKHI